jgi:hypothetical protein
MSQGQTLGGQAACTHAIGIRHASWVIKAYFRLEIVDPSIIQASNKHG